MEAVLSPAAYDREVPDERASPTPSAGFSGARAFHLALALGVLPLLLAPLACGLALWAWRRIAPGPERRWAHRLAGLALLDGIVGALALVVLLAPAEALRAPREPPSVIGVEIVGDAHAGAVVRPVEGGPAARAGVVDGDVITAIDGSPVADARTLAGAVAAGGLEPRRLRIVRAQRTWSTWVRPETGTRVGRLRPGREGLFVPQETSRCLELEGPSLGHGVLYALALCMCLGLTLWTRHRGGPALVVLGVGVAFPAAMATGAGARALACGLTGGPSPGGALVALAAQACVMGALGWLLSRRVSMAPRLSPLPSARAYAQGLTYAVLWVPRAGFLSFGLLSLAELLLGQTGTPIDVFLQAELGLAGTLGVLIAGAVLAPVAEELLFRGALLVALSRTMPIWWAIGVTALVFGILHVHHGASALGPLVLGAVFGWARAATGRLRVPILLHITINAGALSVLLLRG